MTDSTSKQLLGPSRWLRFRSRVVDRVVALAALAVGAPVIAVLAAAVRRRDGPPGLITLDRMGEGGVPFAMWKVRTMRVTAPGGSAGGSVITAGSDPRVTATGRWLRRWRLDELPQLINVARGEMALLGPRPETPSLVDHSDLAWAATLAARPGITGPTQLAVEAWEAQSLCGEDHEDRYRDEILPVKLAIDRWYVESASPLLDLAVVASMIERFAMGRAETAVQRTVRRAVPAARAVPVGPKA